MVDAMHLWLPVIAHSINPLFKELGRMNEQLFICAKFLNRIGIIGLPSVCALAIRISDTYTWQ